MRWLVWWVWPCLLMADPYCGNGEVEAPEECDNGNTESGDGCSSLCLREELLFGLRGDAKDPSVELDPAIAFRRSLVSTLFLPPGLGVVVGPSLGHLYAGEGGRAMALSVLRGGLLAGNVALTLGVFDEQLPADKPRLKPALSLSMGLLLSGLVALDLLDGPRAVARAEKQKAELRRRRPPPASTSAPTSQP